MTKKQIHQAIAFNSFRIVSLLVVAILFVILIYKIKFSADIMPLREEAILFIPTGSSYNQVKDSLKSHLTVRYWGIVDWLAKKKKYTEHIKPGKYVIPGSLSYLDLINILRAGNQIPVKVTFNNITTIVLGCNFLISFKGEIIGGF